MRPVLIIAPACYCPLRARHNVQKWRHRSRRRVGRSSRLVESPHGNEGSCSGARAGGVVMDALIPTVIDTDPGIDDALALLLAWGSPELDLLALTVVAGNAPLANTARN